MTKTGKNTLVLSILFFGPLLFYLFLLTGTNNFAKLPVVTSNVEDVSDFSNKDSVTLKNNISILCFLGSDLLQHKTNALNLNEKIYKHFYGFKGFQFVVVLPKGSENDAAQLKKELGATYNVDKWHFLFTDTSRVQEMFDSLSTSYSLDENSYSPYAFIIDRELNLRGRNDEEALEDGLMYGYNAESVATVHQEMVDDVKVVMAEYRLALKKNKREI
ncbi:hypothetical protein [Lutimonas zeaxanthinifaciens]|uniref:hypothetical protein n=1 Tax=Lutimonas zeaxanthinifaciens TaxID=3060215 RepID=UPI00265D19A6|nr:hypothetical protein [Lutimonas sp. YSD2104]WKK66361.1 hypothetical protein QZH61_01785 [Lutimonas sp. YSD2104]